MNWGFQNTPLTENLYEIHFPAENTGYVASWSGKILKTTNGGLTYTGQISTTVPKNYELRQNFPNPFNPSTIISFQLPRNGNVSIKIYDVNGREVQTLVNESMNAGSYEVSFDATGLSSGVYYYRLEVRNSSSTSNVFSDTKRMMYLR